VPGWLQRHDHGITLALRVQPRAARDEVAGLHGDRLRIRVTTAPVGGAANVHLCRFIARLFEVPPARVRLLRGAAGRDKLVAVAGIRELPGSLAALESAAAGRSRPA
jgi:uncharacterized protein (TIGR00251 family)